MTVKEKDPIDEKSPAEAGPPGGPAWWVKLDEFGQKHARLILTLSAGLIVFTVLVIANVAYKKSVADRLARDLSKAGTAEELRELKLRYAGTPEVALVVAALGNRLYADGKLKEAQAEYDEFMQKHLDHPLRTAVENARNSLAVNLKFETDQKEALLQVPTLDSHPLKNVRLRHDLQRLREKRAELSRTAATDAEAKARLEAVDREIALRMASPVGIGPVKLPHPELVVTVKDKDGKARATFRIELFADEAPETAAKLIELAEKKHFDGLRFSLVGTNERLQMPPKKDVPAETVPFERTGREGDVGSLVMVRHGDSNLAAEFQLLLKSVDAPGDVTIAGIIASDQDREQARRVAADDVIESVVVEKKRPK